MRIFYMFGRFTQNGKSQSPKLVTLLHICEGLGIELNEFFTDNLFKDVEED